MTIKNLTLQKYKNTFCCHLYSIYITTNHNFFIDNFACFQNIIIKDLNILFTVRYNIFLIYSNDYIYELYN